MARQVEPGTGVKTLAQALAALTQSLQAQAPPLRPIEFRPIGEGKLVSSVTGEVITSPTTRET